MSEIEIATKVIMLQEALEKHGMKLGRLKGGGLSDRIAVYPRHDHLPAYTRDTELISGGPDEILFFLMGWIKSRDYLQSLGLITDDKVSRSEQDYLNQKLLDIIKNSEPVSI